MTTVLGKRKSRSAAATATKPAISEKEAQEIFRRHFEAQFAPLEESAPVSTVDGNGENIEDMRSDDDNDDDEWDGISAASGETPEESNKVQVVDYTKPSTPATTTHLATLSKREARAYLSSKVPLSSTDVTIPKPPPSKNSKTPTDEDSADLLKNDLALQRLLAESHLLNPTKHASSQIGAAVTTEHSGRNRHRATDMRLTALGGKERSSVFRQEKMPMSHRKGIEGARQDREARRRREAKENGIVLEKEKAPSSSKKSRGGGGGGGGRRERAVDAPAVGKMSNGMLRLSKRDIDEIQGPARSAGSMKKRRR